MILTKEVKGSFAVDIEHLHSLGVVDPYSPKSLELYSSGQLSSEERLYFTLWGSSQLSTASFSARKRLVTQGEEVHAAYSSCRVICLASKAMKSFGWALAA